MTRSETGSQGDGREPLAATSASPMGPPPRRGALLVTAMLAGAAGALAEWAIIAGQSGVGGVRFIVELVGLWWVAALGAALVETVVLGLVVGRRGGIRARRAVRDAARRWRREQGSQTDQRRVGWILGGLVGAAVFWGLSAGIVRNLVLYRHDPTLIALAAASAELVLLVVALAVGAGTARLGRWLAHLSAGRLSAPRLLLLTLALAAAGSTLVAVRYWSLVVLTGAPSLLLPVAALGLQGALWLLWGHRLARLPVWGRLVWVLLTIALLFVGASDPAARLTTLQHGWTSRYLQSTLARLSDVDRDGLPSPPLGDDCAPFDPRRHPLAREIPGNGRDENCDGLDRIVEFDLGFDRPQPPAPVPEIPPDLVLVTVDSLRADHLGVYGYTVPTSPNLDRMAESSVVFDRAFSQDSGTGPSLWSLLTGKTPFQVELLDAHRFPPRLGPGETTLPEVLQAGNYATAAVLCGSVFGTSYWNIRRGFDSYREVCGRRRDHIADHTVDEALRSLESLRGQSRPFFLWVHLYDPHHNYSDHPEVNFGTSRVNRYDEEIWYTDLHFARLLEALDGLDRGRPLYLAFSADHGENFNEHGDAPHARTLYREVTHVPLIVSGPDVVARHVRAPVAINDLYPTFIQLAGLEVPAGCTMRSLLPVLRGGPPDLDRYVFQENSFSRPRRHVKGVVWRNFHMLLDLTNGTTELYDVAADPGETVNLIGENRAVEHQLELALQAFLHTVEVPENLAP